MTLAEVPLVLMLAGLATYAVLGGADFGAAFWQLGARGRLGPAIREHAYRSIGPVWEANHVWLVFVLVICWTAYPTVFASIFSTLAVPLFVAALGIVLRGMAYTLHVGTQREIERRAVDAVFSVSSIATPFALGTVIGAVASGRVPVGNARGDLLTSWLNPSSIAIGVLAVATGAYLAAVYLAGDAKRGGREELVTAFRARALLMGAATGTIAIAALAVIAADADRTGERLLQWPAAAAVITSAAAGLVTLELLRRHHLAAARYGASAAVAAIVAGWALAQRPQLLPGLMITEAAAGRTTLLLTVAAVAIGTVVLVPSLALLFGLVLHGHFDHETTPPKPPATTPDTQSTHKWASRLACASAALGALLTLLTDTGPLLAAGILALFSFIALGTTTLIRIATTTHD